ncbi:DEAD/DEAH box helicase [Snodgrassella alvi]|uniref:DEAD/DEAH box helicase n=1 Tax=Snodgrassella alvi TaxID=1196083 RepID=A0A2N9X4Z2_9NEIS|nr:DEAD/DEAH box helicase [Snodgrassella alvi]PIT38245.1 DEAD/DEAH box helicase [Snodgrassella alvi]
MDSYQLLNHQVKKWIYQQGWQSLREIQQLAIPPILAAKTDVLITASTAAGKTEAAFLPACSQCMNITDSISILCISPLKALINDQYRRLHSLAEIVSIQLTPWHGDIPASKKNKLKKSPSGIILMTPESLEALLINDSGWFRTAFKSLQYIIIDEFHAFVGRERGQQLLSLLTRVEHLLGKLQTPIPRIALSATLGNIESVPASLRPNQRLQCQIIRETQARSLIKLQLRTYIEPQEATQTKDLPDKIPTYSALSQMCQDLFRLCRNSNHLVFANTRANTESVAVRLSDMCEQNNLPNEFFPHHGSLDKSLRETLEKRLQQNKLPTTAICTSTLELGIDIGKVNSVIQIGCPQSVSSLRQRVGRSGRRGNAAVLRMLITEREVTKKSDITDLLHLELVQALAMVRLLISSKWFEPANPKLLHFSTFLHQILATLAQWGGVRTEQLYHILCKEGPFQNITTYQFKILLSHMGIQQLITQTHNNILVLGVNGEKLVNHYTFYSVFHTPEEYRLITENKILGSIPMLGFLTVNQNIIFAGQRWQIIAINTEDKVILVRHTKAGNPPRFASSSLNIHDAIREEMYKILCAEDFRIPVEQEKADFTDDTTKKMFTGSCQIFKALKLHKENLIQLGNKVYLFPWKGDKIVNTLFALLKREKLDPDMNAGFITIPNSSIQQVKTILQHLAQAQQDEAWILAEQVPERKLEKYDAYLPDNLLLMSYASQAFDTTATHQWLQQFIPTQPETDQT